MMLEAVQTEESDVYGNGGYTAKTDAIPTDAMKTLAEESSASFTTCKYTTSAKAKVTQMTYEKDGHTATWNGTAWTIN